MSSRVSSALKSLASYRAQSSRKSQEVVEKGLVLLQNRNRLTGNDDDGELHLLYPIYGLCLTRDCSMVGATGTSGNRCRKTTDFRSEEHYCMQRKK